MNPSSFFFTNIGKQSFSTECVGTGQYVPSFSLPSNLCYRIEALNTKKFCRLPGGVPAPDSFLYLEVK